MDEKRGKMLQEQLQFSVKPVVMRLLLPKILLLSFLGVLLYFGIELNINLLEIKIKGFMHLIIIAAIVILILIQLFISYRKASAFKYDFYNDRIIIYDPKESYIGYSQIVSSSTKKNIFDHLFGSGRIKINPGENLLAVQQPERVNDYIGKMIAYFRDNNPSQSNQQDLTKNI